MLSDIVTPVQRMAPAQLAAPLLKEQRNTSPMRAAPPHLCSHSVAEKHVAARDRACASRDR
jgi:hypothetical protein